MTNIITKKRLKLLIFIILFIVIAPLVVLYANGDIFSDGWNILATGGIYVSDAPIGSEIFLNNKFEDKTSFFKRDILIRNLVPGKYEIQVKKTEYNTWTKKIQVANNLVENADVFMLPEKIGAREIPEYVFETESNGATSSVKIKNQEYEDILSIFTATSTKISQALSTIGINLKNNLGTKISPIMNGNLGLWNENGKIFVKWFGSNDSAPKYLCDESSDCTENKLVFDLPKSPTEIDFLSGYDGVIVTSVGGLVFAIQIEDNPNKITQIIYTGKDPDFKMIDGSLYVKDGNNISEILL